MSNVNESAATNASVSPATMPSSKPSSPAVMPSSKRPAGSNSPVSAEERNRLAKEALLAYSPGDVIEGKPTLLTKRETGEAFAIVIKYKGVSGFLHANQTPGGESALRELAAQAQVSATVAYVAVDKNRLSLTRRDAAERGPRSGSSNSSQAKRTPAQMLVLQDLAEKVSGGAVCQFKADLVGRSRSGSVTVDVAGMECTVPFNGKLADGQLAIKVRVEEVNPETGVLRLSKAETAPRLTIRQREQEKPAPVKGKRK